MRDAIVSIPVRVLDKPNSEMTVEADEIDHAPDEYAAAYMSLGKGDVVFLETYGVHGHIVWRLECLAAAASMHLFATERTNYEDARKAGDDDQ